MKRYIVLVIFIMLLLISGCKKNNNSDMNNNKEYVTVTFDSDGGTKVESQEVEKGNPIQMVNNPTKEGYTFDGWYYGEEKWSFKSDVALIDMTLTAKWKKVQFTLTIKYNDSITPDLVITQDYNSDIEQIANPTRVGYTFDKWSEDIPIKMPAKDTTISASWIINQYTLTIKYNDGKTPDLVITQDYKSDIQSINNPEKEGYTFFRWSRNIPKKMPAENIEINAEYVCDVTYEIIDGEVTITGANKNKNKIIIFKQYEGFNVTKIGDNAFSECYNLTNVEIPNGVRSLGDGVFKWCTSLTSISIPKGITSIGDSEFYGCTCLTSIVIPNSVTSIGSSAFSSCMGLTSITIPDSVTSIGNSAFSNCSSLTSITIPDSVTSIGNSVFYGCRSLTNIVIPNSVTSIGKSTFYNCSSLTSIIIPDSVTSIGESAFFSCSSLTSITIPNNVISIGRSAFSSCSSLTSITIPDSVTSMGNSVFCGCSNLTKITLPFVGDKEHISSDANQYPFGYIFGTSDYHGGVLTEQLYFESSNLYRAKYYIPSTLKEVVITRSNYIPYGAFYNCSNLTSIIISDNVTSIGRSAFSHCDNLTSIIIPESVTTIEEYAFSKCNNLTIYCRLASQPSDWSSNWNPENRPVVWNYIG